MLTPDVVVRRHTQYRPGATAEVSQTVTLVPGRGATPLARVVPSQPDRSRSTTTATRVSARAPATAHSIPKRS